MPLRPLRCPKQTQHQAKVEWYPQVQAANYVNCNMTRVQKAGVCVLEGVRGMLGGARLLQL
jgi:hypothetical protein